MWNFSKALNHVPMTPPFKLEIYEQLPSLCIFVLLVHSSSALPYINHETRMMMAGGTRKLNTLGSYCPSKSLRPMDPCFAVTFLH
jgi:hypothetical protein